MKGLLLTVFLGVWSTLAVAQTSNCAPFEIVNERLVSKYSEEQRTIGLTSQGAVITQYANDETGTWTIIAVNPNGIACVLAAGDGWEAIASQTASLDIDA